MLGRRKCFKHLRSKLVVGDTYDICINEIAMQVLTRRLPTLTEKWYAVAELHCFVLGFALF
jgi:hypothetical protein